MSATLPKAISATRSPPASPWSIPDPQLAATSTPPRLWPYWLSGISAALLSAGLTWYLTGSGAHRGGPIAQAADLMAPGSAGPALMLPDVPVPDTEPPPAGEPEAPPPSPPGPSAPAAGGELVVETKPAGAEVLIDKKPVGQTPLTLRDLPTDKPLKVELRLSGYKSVHKRLKWHGKTQLGVAVTLHREGEGGSEGGDKPEPLSPTSPTSPASGDKSDSGPGPKPEN